MYETPHVIKVCKYQYGPMGWRNSGHHDIAAFHHNIWNGIAEHRLDEVFTWFGNVHQIARDNQETRHVEGIYNPLGIRIRISDIDQMKGNHQYDEDAFQEIQFVNSLMHLGYLSLLAEIAARSAMLRTRQRDNMSWGQSMAVT